MKPILKASLAGALTAGPLLVVVPWLLARIAARLGLGTPLLAPGVGIALIAAASAWWWTCAIPLSRKGKGTPAPVVPTSRLVTSGPYSWSRNPMYLSYFALLAGITLVGGSIIGAAYAVTLGGFLVWYVHNVEEPRMSERFGKDYERYRSRVSRWVGKKKET